jgi:hypothetical protein
VAALAAYLLWTALSAAQAEDTQKAGLPAIEELLAGTEASIAGVRDYTATVIKQERMKRRDGMSPRESMQFKFARTFCVHIQYLR